MESYVSRVLVHPIQDAVRAAPRPSGKATGVRRMPGRYASRYRVAHVRGRLPFPGRSVGSILKVMRAVSRIGSLSLILLTGCLTSAFSVVPNESSEGGSFNGSDSSVERDSSTIPPILWQSALDSGVGSVDSGPNEPEASTDIDSGMAPHDGGNLLDRGPDSVPPDAMGTEHDSSPPVEAGPLVCPICCKNGNCLWPGCETDSGICGCWYSTSGVCL